MRRRRSNNKCIIFSLMIVILFLVCLIILMFTGVIGKKEESCDIEIKEQKSSVDVSQIIKYYKSMIADYEEARHEYSVIDINNDDIPELLIYTHGIIGKLIITELNVYTYDENLGNEDNNYIVFVGTLNGRLDKDTVFYKMNDGTLLSVTGNMGYEIISSYILENDWLVRTNITSRETMEYTIGDEEIIFKTCTDTSLLDEYK